MESFFNTHHHAILITPYDRTAYSSKLWEKLVTDSLSHRFFNKTILDIDTARELISWSSIPHSGTKVALISFHTATIPAQNALLKILEDPSPCVRFFLVSTNKDKLIPTLISRLHHHQVTEEEGKHSGAAEFLEAHPAERMKLPIIVNLLTKTDEEGRKDRESVRTFIFNLIPVLSENKISSTYLEETAICASYASDPSASGKALIEYLSLLLPQVSH